MRARCVRGKQKGANNLAGIRHEGDRFRPHPVQSGASQIGFGWQPDANRSKPSQNGGAFFDAGKRKETRGIAAFVAPQRALLYFLSS